MTAPELQRRAVGRQAQGRRARAVDDAHDARLATAVLEELLERVGERGGLPQPTEVVLEFGKAAHDERLIDRTLEGAADEGGDSGRHTLDRVIRSALLCVFYAGRGAVGHSSASFGI